MRLIGGNGVVAIADLYVTAWGITLLRCCWKHKDGRDQMGLPCNGILFQSDSDAHRFQQAALAAMRELAKKILEEPAK
jgi:hypothetical protein